MAWIQKIPVCKLVACLEPVDASILSSDKTVKARRHVNSYTRIKVCHSIEMTMLGRILVLGHAFPYHV